MSNDEQEELKRLLDDIDNNGVGLTDWEIEFLDTALKQSDRYGMFFTDKQADIIRRIHRERVDANED